MTDTKIINLDNMKVLKENDSNLTSTNVLNKMKFVDIAQSIIKSVLDSPDDEFQTLLIQCLPDEVINYFHDKEISFYDDDDETLLHDLNLLAKIEKMIGLNSLIFSPTCTDSNPTGWIAGFHMVECMFCSCEMKTESKARAFAIILFLKMRKELNF